MWNQTRNIADDDWLAEDNSAQDIADCSVRRLPHLLEAEFFYTRLIRSDCCALDTNAMLLDRFSRINCHLIISGITVFHAKVVVLEIDIEIRQNQFIFDELPHNAGHLIAIELDYCSFNFDLRHSLLLISYLLKCLYVSLLCADSFCCLFQ